METVIQLYEVVMRLVKDVAGILYDIASTVAH